MVAVGLAVVGAAAVGALWGLRSSKRSTTPAATERTVAVTTGPLRQTVSASGTLRPADTRNLNFSVSGKVTAINAVAGQKVSKDTVLATVDSALLRSQLAQAQAAVDSAIARLSSDTTAGATTAQLSADQAGLSAARAQLASAQTSLSGANLVSPIDGTVASVNLTVGQQLGGSGGSATSISGSGTGSGESSAAVPAANGAGATASSGSSSAGEIVVINTDSFVVDLGIDDTQIGRIAVGQQATVTPSASVGAAGGSAFARGRAIGGTAGGGQPPITTTTAPSAPPVGAPVMSASGTVTSVGVIASSTSGVATFPVVVTIAGNPSGFYAGATAQVTITYQELPGVLQVPTVAVSRSAGQTFVTVSAGGRRVQRPITTGMAANGAVQVTSGLAAGDQVVVTTPVASTGASTSTGGAGRSGVGGDVGGGDIGGVGGGGAGAHAGGDGG